MDWENTLFNRMFIAIPELRLDDDFLNFGVRNGYLSQEAADRIKATMASSKKAAKISGKVWNTKGTIARLAIIMPEILSVSTIDWLRRAELIDATTANALRVVFSGARILKPTFAPQATLLQRVEGVYGALTSSYLVNFIRDLETAQIQTMRDAIIRARGKDPRTAKLSPEEAQIIRALLLKSIKRAQIGRSLFSTADIAIETAKLARAQDDVWGIAGVIFDNFLGSSENADKILKNAIRAGVISESRYELLRSLQKLGGNTWRKLDKASQYDSWIARALLLSEGILSPEMIDSLRKADIIPPELARILYPAATSIRAITRRKLADYIGSTRYNPIAGESAISTYARVTARTDRQILSVLQEAAADSARAAKIAAAKSSIGGQTRAAQQRIIVAELNTKMRELWEHVGFLTIFGEKEAARAGVESISFLNKTLFGTESAEQARSLAAQGRAGVDAFIGREENLKQLSKRVYTNASLATHRVEREIQKALLRGVSAKELADNVSAFIRPGVPGGVSYSAMRLARTEINNAFHFSQIQYSRNMPWVEGYQWHRSGRHGNHTDICDIMATRNHDGLGKGVYKKKSVPGKPHPNCLCFLTAVTVDKGKFEKRLRSGAYDQYLNQAIAGSAMGTKQAQTVRDGGLDWLKAASKISAQTAIAVGATWTANEFLKGFVEGRKS